MATAIQMDTSQEVLTALVEEGAAEEARKAEHWMMILLPKPKYLQMLREVRLTPIQSFPEQMEEEHEQSNLMTKEAEGH